MKSKVILSVLIAGILLCLASCVNVEIEQETTASSNTDSKQTTASTSTVQTTAATEQETTATKSNSKIDNIIKNMSLEEKVGQLFYVRCPDSDAVETVSKYHLGGYILFGKDFEGKTSDKVSSTIDSYQDAAEIPLLIGVDEEGGTVVRVSNNSNLRSTPFLSPSDTFDQGGWDAIKQDAKDKASLLLSLGINVNMAPDCDITSDPDAFMYYRSFSTNVDYECEYVKTYVKITKKRQLGTVLKHFPGYGNNEDSHTDEVYDNRDYSQFEQTDFKPFEAGIKAGADCILVSHNIVSCMDSQYPASLSENVHEIIRVELNFDGVIMTDDLSMDAITKFTDDKTAAVLAVKSGNDILCCTDVATQYPAVLDAVKSGEISKKQINKSVRRILKWKQNLGLI